MEIVLNVSWALLALLSTLLWLLYEHRTGAQRRQPMIALGVLLVILFPVISVSDDLWSIQNPAEADTSLRRDQSAQGTHPVLLSRPPLMVSTLGTIAPEVGILLPPAKSSSPRYATPALNSIENRPPPRA
jgi:hypothetical protein